MIQSMTGYGKATAELSDKKINIEIKSLNCKAGNHYGSIFHGRSVQPGVYYQ